MQAKTGSVHGLGGIPLTGFEIERQINLDPRISVLVSEHLAIIRRHHVRDDGEAGLPWRARGTGPVAADVGCVLCDYYVEVIVAA